MRPLMVLLCSFFFASVAGTQEIVPKPIANGSDYLEDCKYVDGDYNRQTYTANMVCMAWTTGFQNGVLISDFHHEEKERVFCRGYDASTGQIVHIISKYIKDHPEIENETAAKLAYSAMVGAFGCKR